MKELIVKKNFFVYNFLFQTISILGLKFNKIKESRNSMNLK